MTKNEAMQQAINFLDGSYEAHAIRKALQDALAQPKKPQYAYAWLNKEDGSINLEYEFDSWAVMEDPFYKYLGRIKLEVNND